MHIPLYQVSTGLLMQFKVYLVMDLCKGGELFDRICEKGYYYENDAANIVQIILDAVAYLHDRNIVHRDIKPENLIFKTKESLEDLVIADFGLSKIVDNPVFQTLMTRCGTPGYMAPGEHLVLLLLVFIYAD